MAVSAFGVRVSAFVLLPLFAAGCSSVAGPTDAYKATFEKRVGANETQARAFVDALARLPAGERKAYVVQHPADARNLAKVSDTQIQQRYQTLVRGGS